MTRFVAFFGSRRLAYGSMCEVALAMRAAQGAGEPLLAFDFETGAQVDFDLRGAPEEVAARFSHAERGPGRPRLGVVAREVTLLPRHWDWLNAQRGGASAALRRLVDAARAADGGATEAAAGREAAYRIVSALAGDAPNFEDAARALFAGDLAALRWLARDWPPDILAVALARLDAAALSDKKFV